MDKETSIDILLFESVEFEKVFCPVCGPDKAQEELFSAPDRYNGLPGKFFIVQCKKCGVVFQNPRPKEKYIHLFYPDQAGYYNPEQLHESAFRMWLIRKILLNFYGYSNLGTNNFLLKIILVPVYFFFRHRSVPRFVNNGKLLEIGCSTGIKLKWFQNIGWEVSGIEPNRKAADVAIKNGLSVNCGSVFDVDFPEQSYDVIIMDMVLEHLHDSVGALSLVSKWLKKDGQLIFSIPTFDGVEFKIYKDYSYPLQLPCHMVFFGKKNLEALLSGKFKDIRLVYQYVDRDFIASAFYRYREQGRFLDGIVSRNKLVRVLLIKPLSLLLSVFSRTSRVTVFARKQ